MFCHIPTSCGVCGPHAEITVEREGGWGERLCCVFVCVCVCDAGICRMYVERSKECDKGCAGLET